MRCLLSRRCLVVGLFAALLFLSSAPTKGETAPSVEFSLDTAYSFGGQPARMAVYVANYFDSLAGFQLLFQLDRPGVCSLKVAVDTAGCLLSGWPSVEVRHLGSNPYNLQLVALAGSLEGGPQSPIPIQAGDIPLCYLTAQPYDDLDTLFDTEAHVDLILSSLDQFGLSDPSGNSIGVVNVEVLDTVFYRCLEYVDGVCFNWLQVSSPPYDTATYFLDTIPILDTSQVKVTQRGYVGIVTWKCGDFNGDQTVNLTDVTLLVNYLFGAGSPPPRIAPMDVASPCGLQLNLTDLTRLVMSLFQNGGPLTCCPHD